MNRKDAIATLKMMIMDGLSKNADKTKINASMEIENDIVSVILESTCMHWVFPVLFEKEYKVPAPSSIAQRALCPQCEIEHYFTLPPVKAGDIAQRAAELYFADLRPEIGFRRADIDNFVVHIQSAIDEDRREGRLPLANVVAAKVHQIINDSGALAKETEYPFYKVEATIREGIILLSKEPTDEKQ